MNTTNNNSNSPPITAGILVVRLVLSPRYDFDLKDVVSRWSINEVADWAASKFSAQTVKKLRDQEVSGSSLLTLAYGMNYMKNPSLACF